MNLVELDENSRILKKKPTVIVDFAEIIKQKRQQNLRPNIKELLYNSFIIYSVDFGVGRKGEYAIVTTDKGEYFTMSKTLIDQLRAIDEYFAENNVDGVFVRLIEVKSKRDPSKTYLTFMSPMSGDGK